MSRPSLYELENHSDFIQRHIGPTAQQQTAMARAMCRELPRLRERGHPKWRELQPAAQLDTGWPLVRPFQSVLSRCARR